MSENKPPSGPKPTPPPESLSQRGRSGEHPIVVDYRAKMESIADEEGSTSGALLGLDKALDQYLGAMRSEVPPPPPTAEGLPPVSIRGTRPVPTPCEVDSTRDAACVRGTVGCNVAHELEETRSTARMPVVAFCEHGVPENRCKTCKP